uniref:Uncharacterized protein n=1 Tax=Caudovirales sp. ct1Jx6 TaxID=2826765 RepID=A0A8S5MLF0_9CAUD|nr:MAG TPA: hypothetical protein [Caudovirales sp. ct1Jx6]
MSCMILLRGMEYQLFVASFRKTNPFQFRTASVLTLFPSKPPQRSEHTLRTNWGIVKQELFIQPFHPLIFVQSMSTKPMFGR